MESLKYGLLFTLLFAITGLLRGEAPDWSVTPNMYEYSMSATVVVVLNGVESTDENDILGAFVDGECRGWGAPTYFPLTGHYVIGLSLYSNSQSSEDITFKIYDSSEDTIGQINEVLQFESDDIIGSGEDPMVFHARVDYPPEILEMPEYSTNEDEYFDNIFLDDYSEIRDNDSVVWEITETESISANISPGNILSIEPIQPDINGTDTVTLILTDVTVEQFADSQQVVFTILPVDDPPEVSDIPNQTVFQGEAFQEIRLQQYLTEVDGDSIFWIASIIDSLESVDEPDWQINANEYEYNMALNATFVLNNGGAPAPEDVVGAFVNGECRGLASPGYFSITGQYQVGMTVYGHQSEQEEFTLRYYDASEGKTGSIIESLGFVPDGIIGSGADPVEYHALINSFTVTLDSNFIASVWYQEGWSGERTVRFTATDFGTENGYSADDEAVFTVLPRTIAVQNLVLVDQPDSLHVVDHTPLVDYELFDSNGETQTHYRAQVSTSSDFSNIDMWDTGIQESAITQTQYDGTPLQDGATYYLRIRGGIDGLWSEWDEYAFRMNSEPSAPETISPNNLVETGNTPTLRFLASTDNENDALTYTIQLSTDPGFGTIQQEFDGIEIVQDTGYFHTESPLAENAQYWWRLRSSDGYESGGYSDTVNFYVNAVNEPPNPFEVVYPASNDTISNLAPNFQWEIATDPDPLDGISYTLKLDPPEPGIIEYEVGENIEFQYLEELADHAQYFWQIVAMDSDGLVTENTNDWQTFWTNVSNDEPSPFNLIAPANESMVTDEIPTFSWRNSEDPDAVSHGPLTREEAGRVARRISHYELYLGQSPDFDTVEPIAVDSTDYIVTTALDENTEYFWKVVALDNSGGQTASDTWSFWTNFNNEAPNPFATLQPQNHHVLPTQSPEFSWEENGDPDLNDDLIFNLLAGGVHNMLDTLYTGSETSITPNEPMPDNSQIYWKVIAVDFAGAVRLNSGGLQSFIINTENDPPGDFTLITPTADSPEADLTPYFYWEDAIDPDPNDTVDYSLEIAADSLFLNLVTVVDSDESELSLETPLADNSIFYWRVYAQDQHNGSTAASSRRFWTDIYPEAPNDFNLLAPEDGAELPEELITFEWEVTNDNDPYDIIIYNLEIGTTESFQVLLIDTLLTENSLSVDRAELPQQETFHWRISAIDTDSLNTWASGDSTGWEFSPTTSLGPETSIPDEFILNQNYPNPFNPSTMITYGLPQASYVELAIYDISGHRITTLVDESQKAGWHSIQWDGTNEYGKIISTGTYLYRLQTEGKQYIRKMVYMR